MTNPGGRITKDSVLYKLIKAGSVFFVNGKAQFGILTDKTNCRLAGFNCIVTKEEKA